MRLRTIARLTGEAVVSVRDNGLLSMAAVSTVGVSLLVLAIISLLALNLQHVAAVLDAKVQVVVYLDTGPHSLPESELVQEIRALPGVRRAVLVGRATALKQLESEMGLQPAIVADVLRHNPLPNSVDIFITAPSAAAGVAARLHRLPGIAQVNDQQDVVDRLLALTAALRVVGAFLVGALALATLVVVGNTVRVAVYARREQISIMKLVGATDGFIRWPFFIEGALLGLGGALVAGALSWWGYGWLVAVAARSVPFLPILSGGTLLPRLAEALASAGVGLGALGSAISVRRHLRV